MGKKEQRNITSLTTSFANGLKSISETSCQRSDISLFPFTHQNFSELFITVKYIQNVFAVYFYLKLLHKYSYCV